MCAPIFYNHMKFNQHQKTFPKRHQHNIIHATYLLSNAIPYNRPNPQSIKMATFSMTMSRPRSSAALTIFHKYYFPLSHAPRIHKSYLSSFCVQGTAAMYILVAVDFAQHRPEQRSPRERFLVIPRRLRRDSPLSGGRFGSAFVQLSRTSVNIDRIGASGTLTSLGYTFLEMGML